MAYVGEKMGMFRIEEPRAAGLFINVRRFFTTRSTSSRETMDGKIRKHVLLDDVSESATDQSTLFECREVIAEIEYYFMAEFDGETRWTGYGHGGEVRLIVGT